MALWIFTTVKFHALNYNNPVTVKEIKQKTTKIPTTITTGIHPILVSMKSNNKEMLLFVKIAFFKIREMYLNHVNIYQLGLSSALSLLGNLKHLTCISRTCSPYVKKPGRYNTFLPNKFLPRVGGRGSCPTFKRNINQATSPNKQSLETIALYLYV